MKAYVQTKPCVHVSVVALFMTAKPENKQNEGMDEWTLVHLYNRVLFGNNRKNTDTCRNLDKPKKYCTK